MYYCKGRSPALFNNIKLNYCNASHLTTNSRGDWKRKSLMPARKPPGLIFLWSSGTRWSGNQSYIAVPKSTSQITCALWPLLTRDAAKGLYDMSPWSYCCDSLQTRKSQKGAGLAAFQAAHSKQSGNLVKKLLRILWLKQRCVRDNHPWPSHFHPTASQQQKAEPEEPCLRLKKYATIPKHMQYQNKALHWSSATTFLSLLLILHFAVPQSLLLRKWTVGNSAFPWCKYILAYGKEYGKLPSCLRNQLK